MKGAQRQVEAEITVPVWLPPPTEREIRRAEQRIRFPWAAQVYDMAEALGFDLVIEDPVRITRGSFQLPR